jgi:hypothetical protein
MQCQLQDVAVRGAGVAWKGEQVALGVKFQAPFTADLAKQMGVYDIVYNGKKDPAARAFRKLDLGLAIPDAKLVITRHPDLEPVAFSGKLSSLVLTNTGGAITIIFRATVAVEQGILNYVAEQKKEPVLRMEIEGASQSVLQFDDEDGADEGGE